MPHPEPPHSSLKIVEIAGFLTKEPWSGLIPLEEKERVLKSCNLAKLDWERRKSMATTDR